MFSKEKKVLMLQPWGGEEGIKLVRECAAEQGLVCEIIQEPLPFDWKGIRDKLIRWYGPSIRVAITGLRRRKGNDAVLCFDPMCGLVFAALARTLQIKTPPMVISMFLLRNWKYPSLDRLRNLFANYGLARVQRIICFSSFEVDRYRQEFPRHADKFVFVPVGADPTSLDVQREQERIEKEKPEPYIFSGGATNRDYRTLVAAMDDIPMPLKIIAKNSNFPGEHPRLEFLENVYGADYERSLFDATVVVLPLFDRCFASGQLTLLRAMELGKAVVASDVPGMRDYITNGVDGILVPAGDPGAMGEAIRKLLDDPDRRHELGSQARKSHQQSFTQKQSVSGIISYSAELAGMTKRDKV